MIFFLWKDFHTVSCILILKLNWVSVTMASDQKGILVGVLQVALVMSTCCWPLREMCLSSLETPWGASLRMLEENVAQASLLTSAFWTLKRSQSWMYLWHALQVQGFWIGFCLHNEYLTSTAVLCCWFWLTSLLDVSYLKVLRFVEHIIAVILFNFVFQITC